MVFRAITNPSDAVRGGDCAAGLGHAGQIVVVALIFLADIAWPMLCARRWWTRNTTVAFFILLPSSSVVIYYFALSHFVPFWTELIAQWPIYEHIFSPLDFTVGYGWLLVMAVIGAIALWKKSSRSPAEQLLIVWLIVNALLIVSPLDFSDRTSLGFSALLAMLSAIALVRAVPTWHWPAKARQWFAARYPNLSSSFPTILIFIVIPSALLLALSLPLLALSDEGMPFYLGKDDATIIDWLTHHAQPSDVVLGPPTISNLIPAMSDARVYSGHTHETFQPTRKNAEIKQFFSANESDAERRQFLREHQITFVYAQPQSGNTLDGSSVNYLEPIIHSNRSILYKVNLNAN